MVVSFIIHVLYKRMVKHRSSKYGWHIYNRCFHDECRKQGENSNSWMWYALIIKVVF